MDLLHVNDRPGAYPPSWYAATAPLLDPLPALAADTEADVCVIGAGYTGLSTALHLAERGRRVVVLEAHRVGWGASGRNGGQIGSGQRIGQLALERLVGRDAARRLWDLGEAAKTLVHELIDRHAIACDAASGVVHADHRARFVAATRQGVDHLRNAYGYTQIRFLDRDEMRAIVNSADYHGGALDTGAGHLHPLRYALGLARAALAAGVSIHETTEALAVEPGCPAVVATPGGRVRAGTVVLACNGYLRGLDAQVAARVLPINNYIVATAPLGPDGIRTVLRDNVAVADSRFVINYFRPTPDHRLLFGGGESYGYAFPRDIKAFVRRPMLKVFPQLADTPLEYGWGGTLAITRSRLPLLCRPAKGVVSASGYSGQGVALATLAGQVVAEAIAGETGRFDAMAAAPTPPFPGGTRLRHGLLTLAMTYYALRDRL
ncbi:MAG: FAD-binding oxidoreductase [Rhodospirillaceae bacterium]|nr:FAD-binding oxidoreductase [Rhodospirillaceae bacterium]